MTRTRLLLVCLLTFGCLAASVASAQAVCKSWKGGSGNWGTASAWSPEGVPGSSDSVCIAAPATVALPPNGVTLSCPAGGAACQTVSVRATVTEHLRGSKITAVTARRGRKKAATKKKQVVIATGSAALAAGASKTLELTLNRTGSALLARYGKLTAIVTVSLSGKTISTATVHLQRATKGKRK